MLRNSVDFYVADLDPARTWVQVGPGHAVNDMGELWSLYHGRQIKVESGYRPKSSIRLWGEPRAKRHLVAGLVCTAFHGARPDNKEVSHLNGDHRDNRADNLKWETHKENCDRREEHGTQKRGAEHHLAKLNDAQVAEVRALVDSGVSQRVAGARFGVSQATVSGIVNQKGYANVQ